MSSPIRRPYSNLDEKNSAYKSPKVSIPKELGSVEKRAYDLTKHFSQIISESASKPYRLDESDDTSLWENHKALVKRGEDYSQYLLDQNNINKKEKQDAVNEVNQKVKRGLIELDEIREQENKGLVKKIVDFNKDFGKKVKDLERNVTKQIEKMKLELMENIRNEEKDCQKRIAERSNKLIEESIPANTKSTVEIFNRINISGSSPNKFKMSTPEKNYHSALAMKKLEESREKIRELRENSGVSPSVKNNSDYKNKKISSRGFSELSDEKYDYQSEHQDFNDSDQ